MAFRKNDCLLRGSGILVRQNHCQTIEHDGAPWKNTTIASPKNFAPVYTWLFVHPGRQRGQPDHRNDHPGDHVGHLRGGQVLPRDVFLPGSHEEHLAQTQLGLSLFEAGARTSDCYKVGVLFGAE